MQPFWSIFLVSIFLSTLLFYALTFDDKQNLKIASSFQNLPWQTSHNQPPAPIKISHVADKHFYDTQGRQRLFRGVNVEMKSSPFYPKVDVYDPQLSFHEEDIDFLADLNINIIRLGVMW